MARRGQDDDLLIEDELTAAFLGDDDQDDNQQPAGQQEDWLEEDAVPGQLAVDIYETPERLVIKAPIAGIDRSDLDVSITDNTLSIQGTRHSGVKEDEPNYHVQECYWGAFTRSITLPVSVKEEGIKAELKDGVLTVSFEKVKQETVRKIEIS
ncbi:TPA: Hsp20/alpha crystallin family protein [Candidatus Saccharibacteria bacterium]|nr:Hsp20/alpha crystallin family protein [Candidatus Saccharibacteria bacterium]HIO87821.1 Hsp20/alpha crystallin family protein [Candidatus Saccharibacteria bacterium]